MERLSIGGIIYVVVGVIMSSNRGYLVGLGDISNLVSAVLAIALWPLMLFGIDLRIAF